MVNEEIQKTSDDVSDFGFSVRTSDEEFQAWDKNAIIESLKKETGIEDYLALEIADAVEKFITSDGLERITSSLIRELVNAELLKRGLENEYRKYQRLGVPIYDVKNIITARNTAQSSNVPHTTEATNLTLAAAIKKDFALAQVFSPRVTEAHLRGDIHLHKLDFPDRPYCCGQNLEYIKKYGLNVAASLSVAKPAKHADVLISHLIKFSSMLQINFSGAIGWEAVNLFMAPYLVGMSKKEIGALAQMLIYEFNQQNVARGGQAIFSDINLYWEVPDHYANTPAIGPGGKLTGKKYKDYEKEAQRFVWALMEEYLKGDGVGRPFFWPKPNLHITEKFWKTPGWEEFLELASRVAAERGNTEFHFDRGSTVRISQCCRLAFKLDKQDLEETKKPQLMRHSSMQFISINLPRIAYESDHDDKKLFSQIRQRMDLIAQAHRQKKIFIERLLNMEEGGPLAALMTRQKDDPYPYYRLDRAVYLITIYGLNEMIQYHLGQQLHESNQALKFGLKVIAFMRKYAEELSKKWDLRFALEQTPAEGTSYRLAKLDLDQFPRQARSIVKGNPETGAVYYTNSTQLNASFVMDPIERTYKEALFHPLIDAGAMTHIWIGEAKPSAKSIADFVKKTFHNTQSSLIAFSPEFTLCGDCRKTNRGLFEACPHCGSSNVDGMTRVSGFFSLTSRWNKGKKRELRERYRNQKYF